MSTMNSASVRNSEIAGLGLGGTVGVACWGLVGLVRFRFKIGLSSVSACLLACALCGAEGTSACALCGAEGTSACAVAFSGVVWDQSQRCAFCSNRPNRFWKISPLLIKIAFQYGSSSFSPKLPVWLSCRIAARKEMSYQAQRSAFWWNPSNRFWKISTQPGPFSNIQQVTNRPQIGR